MQSHLNRGRECRQYRRRSRAQFTVVPEGLLALGREGTRVPWLSQHPPLPITRGQAEKAWHCGQLLASKLPWYSSEDEPIQSSRHARGIETHVHDAVYCTGERLLRSPKIGHVLVLNRF